MSRIDESTLTTIETELGDDGVWISPDLRDEVPHAVEKQIEASVASASTPTYVTLVDLDYGDPLTNGDPETLASVIRDDTGRSGIYVGLEHQYPDDAPYLLELTAFPADPGLYQAARVASVEHPDDLGAQTLRTLEILESGDARTLYEELDADERAGFSGASADGVSTGTVTGVVAAVLIVLAGVVLAVRRRRTRALPTAPKPTSRSFALPPAVLRTVRAAEDHRNESRAATEVLGLGEAIDAAELDPRRTQALPAWQAALDHYDVGRRILDRDHSPADVVGAIVLARRGQAALASALRGRPWTPQPSCYFNPLHDGGTSPMSWQDGDTRVTVPACPACAGALRRGAEPEGVLDFVSDGRTVHYFKLDLGAWSRTGYGALDTDLLGRLLMRE
ncbi:MAG: hypothetical protein WBP61_18180 [Nocardioides sp.]